MTAITTDLAQVCAYFTQEVTQALGIESDAILRYGVYDFPVQLYKLEGNSVSVIIHRGTFFQKVAAGVEDTHLTLRVQPNGKSAFNSRDAVMLAGSLVRVIQHSVDDAEENELTEVIFVLDNEGWQLVKQAASVVVHAVSAYLGGMLPEVMTLRERDVALHNITLRFSTLELEDGASVRVLPQQFFSHGMNFVTTAKQVQADEQAYLSLVLLEYEVLVRLLVKVTAVSEQSEGLFLVQVALLERPPLAYLVFLGELSKESA